MTGFETTTLPDLTESLRIAQDLVRTLAEQDEAVRQAYERGWTECGEAMAYIGTEQWTSGFVAGRADMENEVNATWTEVAARSHFLGSPMSRTFAEKRAQELERLKPQPSDFLGVERDPQYIDRCRASVELIAHDTRRAA